MSAANVFRESAAEVRCGGCWFSAPADHSPGDIVIWGKHSSNEIHVCADDLDDLIALLQSHQISQHRNTNTKGAAEGVGV